MCVGLMNDNFQLTHEFICPACRQWQTLKANFLINVLL